MKRTAIVLACVALAACKKGGPHDGPGNRLAIASLGTLLISGPATDLRVSSDGHYALFLMHPEKPRLQGVPPQMVLGELYVMPLLGGNPRKLGNGVTNLPGGYLLSPNGRWVLYLTGYNAASESGDLHAVNLDDPTAEPFDLGRGVTYMVVSPDSKWVAFVSNGLLKVGQLEQHQFKDIGAEVANAGFTPDSDWLLFKRTLAAAGSLLATPLAKLDAPRKLADQVGDYIIASDSKRIAFATRSETVHSTYDLFMATLPTLKPVKVASGTSDFAFSKDGRWFARTEGERPEVLGDLYLGPADGSGSRKVGEKVEEFSFAPDSTGLAMLERYDKPAGAGTMTYVALPDGKPKRLGDHVPNYSWATTGHFLTFLERIFKPIYSVDLMLYVTDEEAPFKVNPGVFGYGFGPIGHRLFFRSNCIRNGRACDLFALDLLKPHEPAKKLVEGIYNWKVSDQTDRMLVTYARLDTDAYDVAVYNLNSGVRKTVDQFIVPPAEFANAGAAVVYVDQERSRPGVYLASDIP